MNPATSALLFWTTSIVNRNYRIASAKSRAVIFPFPNRARIQVASNSNLPEPLVRQYDCSDRQISRPESLVWSQTATASRIPDRFVLEEIQ